MGETSSRPKCSTPDTASPTTSHTASDVSDQASDVEYTASEVSDTASQSSAAELEGAQLEGRVVRWRGPVAQRYLFIDVAVARLLPLSSTPPPPGASPKSAPAATQEPPDEEQEAEAEAEVVQVCVPCDDLRSASSALQVGALLRAEVQPEPLPTRRGLRAFGCTRFKGLTPPARRASGSGASTSSSASTSPRQPREEVYGGLAAMRQGMPPPALCKFWVRRGCCGVKGCTFRHDTASASEMAEVDAARAQREARRCALTHDDADPHSAEDKADHRSRHQAFAEWLVDTFGAEALGGGTGVVDVAGGRGQLAFQLQCVNGIPCTLLEPRAVTLTGWQKRYLRRQPDGRRRAYAHVQRLLDPAFEADPEGALLLRSCSALVGMHSDEATEIIADAAIKYGRPFAVVPCCVFPRLFPHRRLPTGEAVESYGDFCAYLEQLAPDIESAYLPLVGRNRVIFRRCAAAPQPARVLAAPAEAYMPQSATRQMRMEHETDIAWNESRSPHRKGDGEDGEGAAPGGPMLTGELQLVEDYFAADARPRVRRSIFSERQQESTSDNGSDSGSDSMDEEDELSLSQQREDPRASSGYSASAYRAALTAAVNPPLNPD